jgi:hypothetical protein
MRGYAVSKDKKKKQNSDDKADKGKKAKSGPAKAVKTMKALADNPLVADIVAAALVGMAAALKDSDKAKKLAGKAGEQLGKMNKTSAKQGGAMWDLALNIGRQTLEALAEETKGGKRGKSR